MPDVIITGPAGRLEAKYTHNGAKDSPIALILHPHPMHRGTMNNKVVFNLYKTFAKRGFSTLRFNFRGVGNSQGQFDRGEGELSDAAAALDWLQAINADSRAVWVAGYSFGSLIGMQLLMRRPEIDRFVIVSPPASMYDFSFLAPCPSSGLVVHGREDDVIPENSVEKLVNKLSTQRGIRVNYKIVDQAGHFYDRDGQIETVIRHVDGYIGDVMASMAGEDELPMAANG